ncbi:acetolactate synthase regulatory subunit [Aspergillus saccharolyticus JOP 1030-1]|uniref:Acetolactate synthase n=1 Tax=Aspergillus saccharolyticus JOP 1030-1 TaxID=1450539 RepID=A0A318ZIS2_9EURO|nr:acetolactate synthase [Aspergillus saccharolyticus JOP 1030-1]PYH47481.1 acetolactate synthase [Aspergillus saccharolyticus JOP 1030-1]
MAFRRPVMLSVTASSTPFLAVASRSSRLAATLPRFTTSSSSSSTSSFVRASSSSTSALAYKALHRRSPLPLPVSDASPQWDAPTAVSSILYETPSVPTNPPKRHILNCLVQNEPGVLSRVSGILAARGFNIDSLVVCNTEVEDLSRMTIVLQGQDGVVEQARRQLDDLVPVWAVLDYTDSALVQRELLLAKVSILGPEFFEELLQHHREITTPGEPAAAEGQNDAKHQIAKTEYHPRNLPQSQALRHKHEHLDAITRLTHQFGGKVLDISTNNCIVEVSAKPSRIDSFMKLIAPFGVLESTRTGLMALPRSPLFEPTEELEKDAADVVDASTLPPG